MKANFASKQKKAAKKKKQKLSKKNKAKAAAATAEDGDAAMDDAAMVEDEPAVIDAIEEEGDDEQGVPSARDKHRKAVTLKRNLKVKVQELKKTRQKVTKVANSKGARRQLTDQIKVLKKKPSPNKK